MGNWSLSKISLVAELGILGVIQGNELRARCPLHQDSNPSFSISLETGLWNCFAQCGGGNFQQLIERVLNCSPQEARDWYESNGRRVGVEQLSRQLAMELGQVPGISPKPASDNWRKHYSTLSTQFLPLWFLERGFTWKTALRWGVRFDPASDAIVIPVRQEGELVGTITRPFKGQPKYKNSLDMPRVLFGIDEISANSSLIILVEGVLDAIWCWQNGLNSVSLLGMNLGQKQIDTLNKHRFAEVVLGLDNDEAGHRGTSKAIQQLGKAGFLLPQISFLQYPDDKKDANDCSPEELLIAYKERKKANFDFKSN